MKAKMTYAAKDLVTFKTRRDARSYVLLVGKNTGAVIDLGKDKAVGSRWAALIVTTLATTPVAQNRTLVLGSRNTETLKSNGYGNKGAHSVKVVTKRSFARV